MKKAVFLDRDGVINHDHGYTSHPDKFDFIDGVFEACQRFIDQGYIIVVVTNQSGIARGYYTETDFQHLTEWMLAQFAEHGVDIAGVYHCPHHPVSGKGDYLTNCDCRKPEPGMLLQAAQDLNIDLAESIIIGDNSTDILAGRKAGLKQCILIDELGDKAKAAKADVVFSSLAQVQLFNQ